MLKTWMKRLLKKLLPWIIGVIYVISPIDIIPDFIGGIGWLDDISVIGLMFLWFLKMFKTSAKSKGTNTDILNRKEENPY